CLFTIILFTAPALAPPPDAKEQMQKLLPAAQVEALPAGRWTVIEDLVPPSGASTQPKHQREFTASSAIRLNDQVLLEEQGLGRCLWGGREGPTTQHAAQVFASFDQFIAANGYAPLPAAPKGFSIRQVAAMPDSPVRLISNPGATMLYVLCLSGDIYSITLPDGPPNKILEGAKYADGGSGQFLGIALAHDGRMYLVGNRFDFNVKPFMNFITVYHSDGPVRDGEAIHPKPWVTASIPFAIDVFQHSVSYIAEGPDSFLYVSSGSRTDHGEKGDNPNRSKEGETSISSCIWRLDRKSDHPQIEIFARGLRNAFGFCWDDRGRMFATENGPNANPPEEVNLIEQGKHYGFPFQ